MDIRNLVFGYKIFFCIISKKKYGINVHLTPHTDEISNFKTQVGSKGDTQK